MSLAVVLSVFGIVFAAELPDKTALASLILGTRYRPWYVFAGVALAFALHAGLAVGAGSMIALLPRKPVEIIASALFALGAVLLLRGRHGDEDLEVTEGSAGFWRVSAMSFGVILVAEFGDLTQIATATLAARYHQPFAVFTGAALGLWGVAALAIIGGRGLLKLVPLTLITRAAAVVMLVLAGVSLAAAVA